MKALILAGGFGKRLRPLTEEKPKPLIEIKGKPIILWQIEWLKKYGIKEVILAVGYKKEKFFEYLGSGKRFGIKIAYVVEEEPLGTAGAIKNAEHLLKNEKFFFVLNGDILTNINLMKMLEIAEKTEYYGYIALVPMKSPYGIVELNDKNEIINFIEKPILEHLLINAGIYLFRPEVFDYLPEKGDIEKQGFPELAKDKKLYGIVFRNYFWKSIDTIKDKEEVEKLDINNALGLP